MYSILYRFVALKNYVCECKTQKNKGRLKTSNP
jgi:hypothetical protein